MRNIAIVGGGDSSEFEISIKSAKAVSDAIKHKYNTYIIIIRGINWYWEQTKGRIIPVDKNDFSLKLPDCKIRFDGVFIAIHGTPGENGLLQGYFDMLSIPYTSCDSFCSALTFNKHACKLFLKEYNIPLATSYKIIAGESFDIDEIIAKLGLPVFVKPNASGSSFGVTKVTGKDKLEPAINDAFKESKEVLIEAFLDGIEVGCGVLKTSKKDFILPITEIVSKNEFFDFEAKYTPGVADEITPARLPETIYKNIQKLSSEIYDILGCKGIVRVDFIVVNDTPVFLEINSVPGMTPESIIPKQITAFGITSSDLYSEVIEDLF